MAFWGFGEGVRSKKGVFRGSKAGTPKRALKGLKRPKKA